MFAQKAKKLTKVSLFVIFTVGAKAFAVTDDRVVLAQLLTGITLGNDGFYNRVLSPSKSLNLNLSSAARTNEMNIKISHEIGNILMIFKMASEANKAEKIKNALRIVDPKIISNGGASIRFTDKKPSAAMARTYFLIQKSAANPKISAQQVLNSFSSYKRSAIPSTTIYEYSDAHNISQSSINTRTGSDQSWKRPLAASEIAKDKDLVLKKCRQILGWKCVTALYKTGDIANDNSVSYLYAGVYDLENNPDHASFAEDKRSTNQITGSTALYVVVESAQWVMIYGIDSQWNSGSLSFTSLIENEFIKDLARIKERLAADMQISVNDLK